MKVIRTAFIALTIFSAACAASPTAPDVPAGAIQVTGTVRYFDLEGGFWAVRGDDGVTYDPINGLGSEFQRDNMRVTLVANDRPATPAIGHQQPPAAVDQRPVVVQPRRQDGCWH